jgi:hypothetical protein
MADYTTYEFFGYIIPGTIFVLGLAAIHPWIAAQVEAYTGNGIDLASLGIFLVVSFTAGHLLHTPLRIGELLFPNSLCEEGVIGASSITKTHFLTDDESKALTKAIEHRYSLILNREKPLDTKTSCNVIRRISIDVHRSNRAALVDIFIRDYGLYMGLATASWLLLIIAVFFHVRCNPLDRIALGFWPLFSLMLLLAGLSTFRMLYFGRAYARELFLAFIALNASWLETRLNAVDFILI